MNNTFDPRRFCGYYNNIRFWMQKPFALNDRSVATNGHILITWPGTLYMAEPIATAATKESIQEIINTALGIGYLYQPLQPLELPEGNTCHDCQGTGKNKPVLCCDCDGEGCKKCRGEGAIRQLKTDHPCPDCLGFGRVTPVNQRFYPEQCEHPYDPDYLRLISELPDLMIYEKTVEFERHHNKIRCGMLYFKSNDIYGALCGMGP